MPLERAGVVVAGAGEFEAKLPVGEVCGEGGRRSLPRGFAPGGRRRRRPGAGDSACPERYHQTRGAGVPFGAGRLVDYAEVAAEEGEAQGIEQRDGEEAEGLAGPGHGAAHPAGALRTEGLGAVPGELSFDAAVFVGMDLIARGAGDDGALGAGDDGPWG